MAFSGDPAEAQKLADDLNQRFPEATRVRFVRLPAIYAALALRQGDSQKANGPRMVPVYMHGEAHLAAHEGTEAATEFQKILDHRGHVGNDPILVLAHLGLGRAYALAGDTIKARAAYQDFLALWKDADPLFPFSSKPKPNTQD
jgi:eukaryotic-like serine/threonine-protein kinase